MNPKEEFLTIVANNIHRDGIDDLLIWLDKTDFFEAPASTRYHNAEEGGLLTHSLNVYQQLEKLCTLYDCNETKETKSIVSLFHDFCKIGCYKQSMRWRKDEHNQWEQYPVYTFDEDFPYGGHGSKSVFLIQTFMNLTPNEASAINCHMGQWDATTYSNPTRVYETNVLAWLLHIADEAADFLMERREYE